MYLLDIPVDDHEPGRHRHRHRRHRRRRDRDDRGVPQEAGARAARAPTAHRLLAEAAKEVTPAIFFSLLIIAVAFLPVFALNGQAGRLFKPLAYTKTFVMLVSALLSITFAPALRDLLHPRQDPAREEPPGLALHHPRLRAVRVRRAPAPEVDDRDRPASRWLSAIPVALAPRQRVHAAAQRGRRRSTCRSPSRTSRSRRRKRQLQHQDRILRSFPGGRDRVRQDRPRRERRPIRRRSRWSRPPCS